MQKKNNLEQLIVSAIEEKKGANITLLNVQSIDRAICDKIIVCEGSSTTQTESISQFIEEKVMLDSDHKLVSRCGYDNAVWIVLDYFDVVVHVFVNKYREQVNIEELWLDADQTKLN